MPQAAPPGGRSPRLEAEVAHDGEQSLWAIRSGIKRLLYSCLVDVLVQSINIHRPLRGDFPPITGLSQALDTYRRLLHEADNLTRQTQQNPSRSRKLA